MRPYLRHPAVLAAAIVAIAATPNSRLVSSEPTSAQAEPAFRTAGAFFAISVADMAASAKWYQDKFGLSIVMSSPKQAGAPAGAMALEGGGLIVELVQHDSARALSQVAPALRSSYLVHGFFKGGVIVDDFDRAVATLRARGVEIAMGPFPRRGAMRANVIVRDNAGNLIQLFGGAPPTPGRAPVP
jgi:catechol 2,3-dioxygenase-like lactoylglutathione lyase family enzyme